MFKMITALLAIGFVTPVFSAQLKSDSLRAKGCNSLLGEYYDTGLEQEYETEYDGDIVVIKDFEKKCSSSKKSFTVKKGNSKYSKKLKAVVSIEVDVDLKLRGAVSFKGTVTLERKASFDVGKDDVVLGKWSNKKTNVKVELRDSFIKKLSEVIVATANYQNGGGGEIGNYTSVDSMVREKNQIISDYNQDGGRCQRTYYYVNTKFRYTLEDYEHNVEDSSTAVDLVKTLNKLGLIKSMESYDVEEWEESCAFRGFLIFLNNGTYIELEYDFTT